MDAISIGLSRQIGFSFLQAPGAGEAYLLILKRCRILPSGNRPFLQHALS